MLLLPFSKNLVEIMNVRQGSYRYDSFEEQIQAQELERLYHQASSLLDVERQLWTELNIRAGQKILDVGCGSGITTRELAKQFCSSKIVGLDISRALLEKAGLYADETIDNQEIYQKKQNLEFEEGSVYDLPFSNHSFDIVYSRLLFQHLNEPSEALSNIWRVLKPGGQICIVDVDKGWSGFYPEPDTSSVLDRAVIERQLAKCCDPWVGRKLGYYLKSAGFTRVKTKVTLIDSNQLGLANFFRMLSVESSSQLETDELAPLRKQAISDMQDLLNDPNAWAGLGLFLVIGYKD